MEVFQNNDSVLEIIEIISQSVSLSVASHVNGTDGLDEMSLSFAT